MRLLVVHLHTSSVPLKSHHTNVSNFFLILQNIICGNRTASTVTTAVSMTKQEQAIIGYITFFMQESAQTHEIPVYFVFL